MISVDSSQSSVEDDDDNDEDDATGPAPDRLLANGHYKTPRPATVSCHHAAADNKDVQSNDSVGSNEVFLGPSSTTEGDSVPNNGPVVPLLRAINED